MGPLSKHTAVVLHVCLPDETASSSEAGAKSYTLVGHPWSWATLLNTRCWVMLEDGHGFSMMANTFGLPRLLPSLSLRGPSSSHAVRSHLSQGVIRQEETNKRYYRTRTFGLFPDIPPRFLLFHFDLFLHFI